MLKTWTVLLAWSLALATTEAGAQTICHAENDGPNFRDNVSTGGPNLLVGIKFDAPADFNCTAIEVFTGEGSGPNTVALWTHDAGPNEPGSQLNVGSWSMSNTNSWQGASLGAPVALVSGQTYWMVWGPQNGSQSSIDLPMSFLGQVYRGSFDGGATWSGPFQFDDIHWKFRLYGDCGGSGVVLCFGDGTGAACGCGNESAPGAGGCLNSLGEAGLLGASGSPDTTNDTLSLTCTGVRSQPGLFFQGDNTIGGGAGSPFGDGIRCCGQNVVRVQVVVPPQPEPSTAQLTATVTTSGPAGTVQPGDTKCYQYWYRDPGGSPCGSSFNLSNAVSVIWL